MRILIGLALLCGACSKSSNESQATPAPTEGTPRQLLGIDPEKWTCTTLASDADIGTALGGTARAVDSPFKPPRGVPNPCNYKVQLAGAGGDAGPPPEESWTYDVDCRADYEERVEVLFAQYTQQSADLVASYKASMGSNAKPPTDDAGVALKAPEDAFGVEVGRKALDHHGQGLLFVDDDSPCYVRVVGPDAARRLALAQLVAAALHEANAPMPVHGKPVMK
jgi:hypothetical protein